jgi:hypothetical protein
MATKKKIVGSFCKRTAHPKSSFDERSFRWKQSGRAWLLVGCPKGKWQPRNERCSVGTKAFEILSPAKIGKRCSVGRKTRKG